MVDNGTDEVKAHTDGIIDTMRKILKRKANRGGVPFANLVLSRNSFSQTVENIFAFSFLVRMGRVELKMTDDGILTCCKYRTGLRAPFGSWRSYWSHPPKILSVIIWRSFSNVEKRGLGF